MPLHVVGVSIPRSGHHYLARLLRAACGRQLHYCDFYGTHDCCRSVPCRRSGATILLQKNHDLDLRLANDLPGVRYLVQIRHPVVAALSDRELYSSVHGEALVADRSALMLWLASHALWLEDFHAKWVDPAPADATLLPYERLVERPAEVLSGLFADWGVVVAPAEIHAAVTAVSPLGGVEGERQYRQRRLAESRFLDGELFPLFESLLIGRLPGPIWHRLLPARSDPTHPLVRCWQALRSARRGDLDGAVSALDEISRCLGCPAALEGEISRLQVSRGELNDARRRLSAALLDRPNDPALLLRWIELCRDQLDSKAAVEQAIRLVELMPDEVGHRVLLALVLGEAGDRARTVEAVAKARAVDPRNPLDWCTLGLAMVYVGLGSEASALVEAALVRWPDHPGLVSVRARVAGETT